MAIKGIVFDFNGTLFWDTRLHNEAWDLFMEEKGMSLTDQEKNEKLHGKNNQDILALLYQRELSRDEIAKLSREKERIYQELCLQTEMQLAPGAPELLEHLKTNNIPINIATASDLGNVEFYFEHLGLSRYFERSMVVYNNGEMLSKPHPQLFQKAIDALGITARETLIFEDSQSGILAAENAGAGRIIIVDSNGDDYSHWSYQRIKNFSEVDFHIFETN